MCIKFDKWEIGQTKESIKNNDGDNTKTKL